MTTNQMLLTAIAKHMAIPADSGIGRLTRSHLFTALYTEQGSYLPAGVRASEAQVWAFIKIVDKAREERLFAAQRAHAAQLRQINAEMTWKPTPWRG